MIAINFVRLPLLQLLIAMGIAGSAALISCEPQSFKAQSLPPILPLPSGARPVPFLVEALRDQEILRSRPDNSLDATRLANEVKQMRSDLATAKGARATELHEHAYEGFVALAYYFEDVASGTLGTQNERAKARENLAAMRQQAIFHANSFVRMTQNNQAKARAMYHLSVLPYVAGENSSAVSQIRSLVASPSLSQNLKSRANVLLALYDINQGTDKDRRQAIAKLRQSANQSDKLGIAAGLSLAQGMAGLNSQGQKRSQANAGYRQVLNQALNKTASLNTAQKEEALSFGIFVWRAAEGGRGSWSNPPLPLNHFAESATAKALIERAALDDWSQGRRNAAVQKYRALADSYQGQPLRASLDQRRLDLARANHLTTKDARAYEQELLSVYKIYLDPGILGNGGERQVQAMRADIARRHGMLVHSELDAVGQGGTSRYQVAIAIADNYLRTINDPKEIERVKAKIALAYAANRQHRQAVAIYNELAETNTSGQAKFYWSKAIASQSVLASWPLEAPWPGLATTLQQERENLLALYNKLAKTSDKKTDWPILSHIGLLEVNLGRAENAFKTWTAAIQQEPRHAHAAQAMGLMLVVYEKARSWQKIEDLSRFGLKQGLAARYGTRTLNLNTLLGLSLLEGGKVAIAEKRYPAAVAKLKEFTENFPNAANHDEGYYLLASAYRGSGQHELSIRTLLGFVERYPRTRFYRAALLSGGEWSQNMAYEENVIFFYNRFVQDFEGDREEPRVRETLTALYMGRSLYSETLGLLAAKTQDRSTNEATRLETMHDMMLLEQRQGSMARAAEIANRLIASPAGTEIKADAYVLKARLAVKDNRLAELRQIEQALAALAGRDPAAQDALGETRFYLAETQSKTVIQEYFNLELKDPLATLNQRFSAYQSAQNAYRLVCQAGTTSYCAPAMLRLARVSEEFLSSLEDINVQDTLAKAEVARFQNRKQAILNEVAATSQQADSRAVNTVSQGGTDPYWTQEVLWQNNSNWNFDRVSGETGNGYMQWTTQDQAN